MKPNQLLTLDSVAELLGIDPDNASDEDVGELFDAVEELGIEPARVDATGRSFYHPRQVRRIAAALDKLELLGDDEPADIFGGPEEHGA